MSSQLSAINIAVATMGLISLCYAKGPSPKWRGGPKPTNNPEEDW